MAAEIINSIKDIQEKYELALKIPVFATQEYADYLLKTKNIKTIWFVERNNNSIKFIIPFAIKRKLIFKIGYFLTAVNNLGENNLEDESEFLEEIVSLIKAKQLCDWIQQPPNWAIFNTVPSNSTFCDFGTYKINLMKYSEEELYAKINNHHRRLINKSLKNNVIINSGHKIIDDCSYVFSAATKAGNHTLPSKNEIKELIEYLSDYIKIYVSYLNSVPQSGIVCFLNNFSMYAAYIGKQPTSKIGENHLLHWQAIKDAKEDEIKYFDFIGARINPDTGSKLEGIQSFKKNFGGEFIKGFLWKMQIRKTKYQIYNFLVDLSYLLKGKKNKGDIIDQELKRFTIKKSNEKN